ncbi:hypothetical protein LEP1GSC188_1882 [Leptospira weilii serovar Topaz str. LT2116]|uniref:Uncharacterized protein n=1 Tax=Leptospira weilii serovar Topaz str. LT2116 TaxID=1088540 RepID=M3FLK8_9LEPT|nr:hypothetical protein LEP1GSC188_1882 [Leptospira weilii serovar Topaz str. LT2116]
MNFKLIEYSNLEINFFLKKSKLFSKLILRNQVGKKLWLFLSLIFEETFAILIYKIDLEFYFIRNFCSFQVAFY